MKETMTIHKSLSELKVLDSRISKAMDATFVVANKHNNAKIGGVSIADFSNGVKDAYQSVRTLINRRNAIKRAVTRSNANTMVNINGQEFTVAEAIDMKGKGIEYLSSLYDILSSQLAKAKRKADGENGDMLSARADDYVKSLYAGADLKNMADEISKVRDTFITAQTIEIVDPIHAEETCKNLRDYIDSFMSEVDSALSVSNALTTVEVEYETK